MTEECSRAIFALRQCLKWFVDRRSSIQGKFDLHGPRDTADAMRDAFACAARAIEGSDKVWWRPIEFAPHDPKALVIAWNGSRDVARWDAPAELAWSDSAQGFVPQPGRWVHANEGNPIHPQPTHFILCPPAPVV